jgi:hypothetical protein
LVKLSSVVGGLEQRELGNVHSVHPWLVGHKVFKIVFNGLCDLDDVPFDLPLQPQAQA